MQMFRPSHLLARLVLAWFVLLVGTSVSASLLEPGGLQMVCSVGGTMSLVDTSDGDTHTSTVGMDCPLCAHISAPPPPSTAFIHIASPLAYALQPIAAAHIVSATSPPLPSRGPPLSSRT